jgi:hypothetical protein
MAACALHNYLTDKNVRGSDDIVDNLNDSTGKEKLVAHIQHIPRVKGAHYNSASKAIRDNLAQYFVSDGQIPWQWKHGNVHVNHDSEEESD